MAFLDDQQLTGRPVQLKFLDMMALKPQSQEEVKTALHKLPELKLRPEKLADDEDVVQPLSCKNIKDFPYLDPIPCSMLHVSIRELSSVDIDWKMLTLDRPETQLEINIFSRMIYLDKLMMRDIIVEKKKKEKENFIRLRTKGKWKPPTDSDVDKSDEFTYEYFSRFFGSNGGVEGIEEISKPKTPEDAKPPPSAPNEDQTSKSLAPPPTHRNKRRHVRKKLRRKKKKKKSKKAKLRKRKPKTLSKVDERIRRFRSLIAKSRNKSKKSKTSVVSKKKTSISGTRTKKKSDSNKTLIQMLKSSEQQDKKKSQSSPKSQSSVQPKRADD